MPNSSPLKGKVSAAVKSGNSESTLRGSARASSTPRGVSPSTISKRTTSLKSQPSSRPQVQRKSKPQGSPLTSRAYSDESAKKTFVGQPSPLDDQIKSVIKSLVDEALKNNLGQVIKDTVAFEVKPLLERIEKLEQENVAFNILHERVSALEAMGKLAPRQYMRASSLKSSFSNKPPVDNNKSNNEEKTNEMDEFEADEDANIYLDEMEKAMLHELNQTLIKRHSSLPRNSGSELRSSRSSSTSSPSPRSALEMKKGGVAKKGAGSSLRNLSAGRIRWPSNTSKKVADNNTTTNATVSGGSRHSKNKGTSLDGVVGNREGGNDEIKHVKPHSKQLKSSSSSSLSQASHSSPTTVTDMPLPTPPDSLSPSPSTSITETRRNMFASDITPTTFSSSLNSSQTRRQENQIELPSPAIEISKTESKTKAGSGIVTTLPIRHAQRRMSPLASLGFQKILKKGVLVKALAGQLKAAVEDIEPSVTSLLSDIATKSKGKLVGLEYKFKSTQSLLAKIDRDVYEANMAILENLDRRRKNAEGKSKIETVQASGEKEQRKLRRSTISVMALKRNSSDAEQASFMIDSLKQADLLAQKTSDRVKEAMLEIQQQAQKEGDTEVDVPKIVWNISDALRYTLIFNTEGYTENVKKAIDRLKLYGMIPFKMKNYWGPGDGYQGINDVFLIPSKMSATGHVKVEIQFHTQESFDHKMAVHGMYEEFRTTKDPTRKVELWKECVDMADTIPVPKDVLALPELKTQPMPIETTLYVDLVLSRALKIQQPAVDIVNRVLSTIRLPQYLDSNHQSRKIAAQVTCQLLSPSAIELRIISDMRMSSHDHFKTLTQHQSISNDISSLGASGEKGGEGGSSFDDHHAHELKLKDAALRISDALVINIVLEDEETYATSIELFQAELFKKGFEGEMIEIKTTNAWIKPTLFKRRGPTGGIGVYTHVTMEGEDDGVAFTPDDAYPVIIAFHTAASLKARISLQTAWSDYRTANTNRQRNAALVKAQRITSEVPVPIGARAVRGSTWMQLARIQSSMGAEDSSEEEEEEESGG